MFLLTKYSIFFNQHSLPFSTNNFLVEMLSCQKIYRFAFVFWWANICNLHLYLFAFVFWWKSKLWMDEWMNECSSFLLNLEDLLRITSISICIQFPKMYFLKCNSQNLFVKMYFSKCISQNVTYQTNGQTFADFCFKWANQPSVLFQPLLLSIKQTLHKGAQLEIWISSPT